MTEIFDFSSRKFIFYFSLTACLLMINYYCSTCARWKRGRRSKCWNNRFQWDVPHAKPNLPNRRIRICPACYAQYSKASTQIHAESMKNTKNTQKWVSMQFFVVDVNTTYTCFSIFVVLLFMTKQVKFYNILLLQMVRRLVKIIWR